MQVDLTDEEARLLALHLTKHIKHVDDELVHTDKRSMQRDLALDERRLLGILEKLESTMSAAGLAAPTNGNGSGNGRRVERRHSTR
jgi:hypothetical protein